MSKEDVFQTVKELAQLALLSNRISDFHEKNLRAYPFVFFNDLDSVVLTYDLSRQLDSKDLSPGVEHNAVRYDLSLKDSASNDFLEKRFLALEQSVRNLLWSDIVLIVSINGKVVYESNKNV